MEMEEIKRKKDTSETVQEPNQSNIINVKEFERKINVEKEKPAVNMFKEYIAEQKNKGTRSKTKIKKDMVKKDLAKEELLKCNKCEYETKKEAALKKHIVSNHEDHECK